MHAGSHDCNHHAICGPQLSVIIWARYLTFRGDPEEKLPPMVLKVWRNVCGYDAFRQLHTTYGSKVDAIRVCCTNRLQ